MSLCCICQSKLPAKGRSTNPNYSQLYCGHEMHASCLVTWLQQDSSCPLCRANVSPVKTVVVHTERPIIQTITNLFHIVWPFLWAAILVSLLIASFYFLYQEVCDSGLFHLAKSFGSYFMVLCFLCFLYNYVQSWLAR
jgi:hypothetical protein